MSNSNLNLIESMLKEILELIEEEKKNGNTVYTTNTTGNFTYNSNLRDKVIEIAKKYIGRPYVWAGNGPDNFDCGGFTQYVYREAGLIPNDGSDTASKGQRLWGKETTNPRPGDLICYEGHVAIYLNENQIIHASKGAGKVIIASKNIGLQPICYRNLIGD